METEKYVICKYCSALSKYEENHVSNCSMIMNYTNVDGILRCYSCGNENKTYSASQLAKEYQARCTDCVNNKKTTKFEPFAHLYSSNYNNIKSDSYSINKQLMYYVSSLDIQKVEELLQQGANPNYNRQLTFYDDKFTFQHIDVCDKDGNEVPEIDEYQPTTPLKMCVYRYSDCMLNTVDLNRIRNMVVLLIKYGATTDGIKDAIHLFHSRYGGYDENEREGERAEQLVSESDNATNDANDNDIQNDFELLYKLLKDNLLPVR